MTEVLGGVNDVCPITGDAVDNSETWHCPDCEREYGRAKIGGGAATFRATSAEPIDRLTELLGDAEDVIELLGFTVPAKIPFIVGDVLELGWKKRGGASGLVVYRNDGAEIDALKTSKKIRIAIPAYLPALLDALAIAEDRVNVELARSIEVVDEFIHAVNEFVAGRGALPTDPRS